MRFDGFDHIDTRVSSVAQVEPFYDALMPRLGLVRKQYSFVDPDGEWHAREVGEAYNAVEYVEEADGRVPAFIGFIEQAGVVPTRTRIAFRVPGDALLAWVDVLFSIGARHVEPSADMSAYPAVFFEDPAGTCLELCARRRP
jgi:hypothetical protein